MHTYNFRCDKHLYYVFCMALPHQATVPQVSQLRRFCAKRTRQLETASPFIIPFSVRPALLAACLSVGHEAGAERTQAKRR
jgi:hypothetical protein